MHGDNLPADQALSDLDFLRPSPAEGASVPAEKAIVRELFEQLEEHGVRYCHWKSNIRLADTLAGKEDIDLLVDPRDAATFYAVLAAVGFRLTETRSNVGHPCVFHALALDQSTAELVDLHAYFQIVSGDSLVKNYRFPIEIELLEQSRYLHGVRVPDANAELAIFVLRMALKHLSPIEILKSNRHYEKVTAELAWLLENAAAKEAGALATRWFPGIEPALFEDGLRSIAARRQLLRRILVARRIAQRMRGYRRLGAARALASRWMRLRSALAKQLRDRRELHLTSGGGIIALVGPKGSGKSTLGMELAARLGRHLDIRRIHTGKPPATALSFVPRLLTPLARVLFPHARLGEYERPERRNARMYSLPYVARMLLLAYDRRALLRRALRHASAGTIIVSDRYPSNIVGAADSSRFDDLAEANASSRLMRWMMARERALYREMPRPRLIVRLVAPLEIALERDAARFKLQGPNPEAVRRRWDMEGLAEFSRAPIVHVDTSGRLDVTADAVVREVWGAL